METPISQKIILREGNLTTEQNLRKGNSGELVTKQSGSSLLKHEGVQKESKKDKQSNLNNLMKKLTSFKEEY